MGSLSPAFAIGSLIRFRAVLLINQVLNHFKADLQIGHEAGVSSFGTHHKTLTDSVTSPATPRMTDGRAMVAALEGRMTTTLEAVAVMSM